ncbi:MAG: ADP-ribosylglycohydrolase family protein [Candidatus Pacebacteria bacterium]|jgi:ADP-ribosyl-[dinitrogen reductase] hydrolase|nr:ADP-ribosylglycohydrolase family protein [Candidatus Paceibacterota bacterium]
MEITLQDRFRGALVGVLAGDALGAPYELGKAADIDADFAKRGGLTAFGYQNPFYGKTEDIKEFPAGRPTDDSDHTAALAKSLIESNGLDEKDLFYRLRSIVVNGWSPLWGGKAVGAGRTTRKMLAPETYEESYAIPSKGAFPSNGSLMRSAPMALYFAATRPTGGIDRDMVARMSRVTHRHPLAVRCCVAYASILYELLLGYHRDGASQRAIQLGYDWDHESGVLNLHREEIPWQVSLADMLADPTVHPRDPWGKPGIGDVLLTLHVALWALYTTSSFREGITKVVALGGDTDTYAAVAGGLLGAYYGEQGIPPEWRNVLLGRQVMENLADEFCIWANQSA